MEVEVTLWNWQHNSDKKRQKNQETTLETMTARQDGPIRSRASVHPSRNMLEKECQPAAGALLMPLWNGMWNKIITKQAPCFKKNYINIGQLHTLAKKDDTYLRLEEELAEELFCRNIFPLFHLLAVWCYNTSLYSLSLFWGIKWDLLG